MYVDAQFVIHFLFFSSLSLTTEPFLAEHVFVEGHSEPEGDSDTVKAAAAPLYLTHSPLYHTQYCYSAITMNYKWSPVNCMIWE